MRRDFRWSACSCRLATQASARRATPGPQARVCDLAQPCTLADALGRARMCSQTASGCTRRANGDGYGRSSGCRTVSVTALISGVVESVPARPFACTAAS
eukprot:2043425-Pleurochrysis_carterae.AAC.1